MKGLLAMSQQKKAAHTGNPGLFIVGSVIYLGLLILFGYQTWQFVDWLFPSDQILMKLLTVLCFDVMALFWACTDLFYRFKSRGAHTLVLWAWAVSFLLSLLASIFYLVIESMFRFQIALNEQTVDIGYGITIGALTLNILFLTFWLYLEWSERHPHRNEYDDEDEKPVPAAQPAITQQPASTPAPTSTPKQPAPVYTTPKQNPEFFEREFRKMQEELAELKKQRQQPTPAQPETNVSQPAPKRPYPILPDAPRYVDTEPLTPPAQPSYADDLAESVGGAAANPLASQNGHQK